MPTQRRARHTHRAGRTKKHVTQPAKHVTRPAPKTVREVMTRRPVSVQADAPLEEARMILLWSPFRHLPVLDGTTLAGILSDRDLLTALARYGREKMAELRVRDVMRLGVHFALPSMDVKEAADLIVARQIGCLPVTEEGNLIGILTSKDLLAEVPRTRPKPPSKERTARDLMTADPATATEETPLFDAVALMAELGLRHLPVVDSNGRLSGMLSDRDVRSTIGDPGEELRHGVHWDLEGLTVGEVMSRDPVRVELDATKGEIAATLSDDRIGALPVVDEADRPIGIVSYVDLLAPTRE